MVKSRRSASSRKSRPNATLAWRPSVSTSRLSVVASIGLPSTISVTVPWARPVGATPKPAARARFITTSGTRGGGEVEIADRRAEREVAHRAADQPGLFAVAVQRGERAGEPAGLEQATVGEAPVSQAGQRAHSIRPGTRTPFSTWAGM